LASSISRFGLGAREVGLEELLLVGLDGEAPEGFAWLMVIGPAIRSGNRS
jgi:hypothetical protein